jgi:uncharacterized protein
MSNINLRIAQELAVSPKQVDAAVRLLDDGATVPFIARYRKEATGSLDDQQLRELSQRLGYLRELELRSQLVLDSIRQQGKLNTRLEQQIRAAKTKTELEDLYLPFKSKRRTKADRARESGLSPLADQLRQSATHSPEQIARPFVDPARGIIDVSTALEGARQILFEKPATDPGVSAQLRNQLWNRGILHVQVIEKKRDDAANFKDYFDYQEPIRRLPSHRTLAILRGQAAGALRYRLQLPDEEQARAESVIYRHLVNNNQHRGTLTWLQETAHQCWIQKLRPRLETELVAKLREQAETDAIQVFARNLKNLLLGAPAGPRVTLGLDPGFRSGIKCAVVDATGKLLDHCTLYPHPPQNRWDNALAQLARLCLEHHVNLISIGNGTASRETDRLATELIDSRPELPLHKVIVSEAGASVYSASELASQEFPELDVTIRSAVSIARRLQDPLAELVKIEPKAIGVGQYQHDLNQKHLAQSLDDVVEDCVNHVGVDLNTTSAPLLARVSGLSNSIAANIIRYRDEQGAFRERRQLLKVPRLGPKAFEQAAGFLRIHDGSHPLDASGVHPEAYPLVEAIAKRNHCSLPDLISNGSLLRTLNPEEYCDDRFGVPSVRDILTELEKPGRDPRPNFTTVRFKAEVESVKDLKPDMELQGIVTNVTNFGAFIDIGVHQDGLVHISQLADRFVKDPYEVVSTGQVVRVRVLAIDPGRQRISLSMRKQNQPSE